MWKIGAGSGTVAGTKGWAIDIRGGAVEIGTMVVIGGGNAIETDYWGKVVPWVRVQWLVVRLLQKPC